MMHRRKLLLVALTTALLLTLGAGSASANRSLAVSGGGRAISATVRGFELGEGNIFVSCAATLNGSMRSPISKVIGSEIATIPEVPTASCRNNLGVRPTSLTVLATPLLPWVMNFVNYQGTLPNIREITISIIRVWILMRIEALSCLYQGSVPFLTEGTMGSGTFTWRNFHSEGGNSLTLSASRGEEGMRTCPATARLGGQAMEFTTEVTLTLI
jgi:hypothetical protein